MNELSIVVFVLSFFVALFILERLFPLRSKARPFGHLIINGIFTASLVLVAFFLVRPIIRGFFTLIEEWNFGLIPWLNWPLWLEGVLGFLLLDLSVYYCVLSALVRPTLRGEISYVFGVA